MIWTEELWPLVIQIYLKKPLGIKPLYSRDIVNLALELHIPPQIIHRKLSLLRRNPTPTLKRMMEAYEKKPQWLKKACQATRQIQGLGTAGELFRDVEIKETFELDFRPVNAATAMMMGRPLYTPVMLIMLLNLYFCLVPQTMVAETPEVKELASLLEIEPKDVVDILEIYQYCDPFINTPESLMDPMLPPCHKIWEKYSDDIEKLSALAEQLKYYWLL
ncbi:MAG: hypothetical protein SOW79_03735 [Prevotella sp.]|nr:hypothetical protein [Prevotella sp.]